LLPQISESTKSKSSWKIPVPHASDKMMYILKLLIPNIADS
ncbi:14153_t:CDS:1, partial [Funneliformis geosporum]